MEKYEVIMNACQALSDGQDEECLKIINDQYRFDPQVEPRKVPHPKVTVTSKVGSGTEGWNDDPLLRMKVFARDGFVNRFTGELLVLPAAMNIISERWPVDFPNHRNWMIGKTHIAYYDLGACANKLRTSTMGGREAEDNLITTTMPYVLARSNASIEDVGWKVFEPGDVKEWDGMSTWYIEYLDDNPSLRKKYSVNKWYKAARKVLMDSH